MKRSGMTLAVFSDEAALSEEDASCVAARAC